MIDGLGIDEEAQERKSKRVCEEKHLVGSVHMLSRRRDASFIAASVLRRHPLRVRLWTPINNRYPGLSRAADVTGAITVL